MNSFFGSTLSDAQNAITQQAQMDAARTMASEQGLRDMLMQSGRLRTVSTEGERDRAARMQEAQLRDALARYQTGETGTLERYKVDEAGKLSVKRLGIDEEMLGIARSRAGREEEQARLDRELKMNIADKNIEASLLGGIFSSLRSDPRVTEAKLGIQQQSEADAIEGDAVASQLNASLTRAEQSAESDWHPIYAGSWDKELRKTKVDQAKAAAVASLGTKSSLVKWVPNEKLLAGGRFVSAFKGGGIPSAPSNVESPGLSLDGVLESYLSRFGGTNGMGGEVVNTNAPTRVTFGQTAAEIARRLNAGRVRSGTGE